MRQIVHYVGFYDMPENARERRVSSPAATTKMRYIADGLRRVGCDVTIVSAAQTLSSLGFPGRTESFGRHFRVVYLRTLGHRGVLYRALRRFYWNTSLFMYLVFKTHRGCPVLVYHSLALQRTVLVAKALRGFRLILEVEEVYQDIVNCSRSARRTEHRIFRAADAFLFSSSRLSRAVNCDNKPEVLIYGAYEVTRSGASPVEGERVHVVYAGTLDPKKGGAIAAAKAARHLDERFHVHILGFGTTEQVGEMRTMCAALSADGGAHLSYDGVLHGDELRMLLGNCSIGLSTQIADASFSNTSFPSKIVSYLAAGLSVVSGRFDGVVDSPFDSFLFYYDSQIPEDIAHAIYAASQGPRDGRAMILELDRAFLASLPKVLQGDA